MNRPLSRPGWLDAGALIRLAGRGLFETLTAPDPAPRLRTRGQRVGVAACTALGVAIAVLAFITAILAASRPEVSIAPFGPPPDLHAQRLEISASLAMLFLAVRYPLLAWRLGYATVLLAPLIAGEPRMSVILALTLAVVFVVAALRHTRLVLWTMWTLMLVPIWLWGKEGGSKTVFATAALTAIAAALQAQATRRRADDALAEQVAHNEHEEARRAVLEERARIAREMHDVVAHHMSMIAVQAETAPYRLHDLGEGTSGELDAGTVAEFASLSGAAREALADLRSLLGVLRNDEPAERAPQPQLADVTELVETTRRAGVAVDLTMHVGDDPVPAPVALCGYRIVQEALSNAVRHAPGSRVTVDIERDERALRLAITNSAPSPAIQEPSTRLREIDRIGHGIAGMRERITLLGGSLTAGPMADGGYAVAATLPLARR